MLSAWSDVVRFVLSSIVATTLASCAPTASARPSTTAACVAPNADDRSSLVVERWHELARGEDGWVNLVASPFVQHALRSERIVELAAQCLDEAGNARVVAGVEAELVFRLLALGLSHATDSQLRELGGRLREVAQIDDDTDLVRAIDVLRAVEMPSDDTQQSLERVTRLWPTGDPRPPTRDDLARSAVASARVWFSYHDPRITPEQRSGWCMSGQPMALAFWNPTASAAYAIGTGASPADVEALVLEAVREMMRVE